MKLLLTKKSRQKIGGKFMSFGGGGRLLCLSRLLLPFNLLRCVLVIDIAGMAQARSVACSGMLRHLIQYESKRCGLRFS